MNTCFDGNERGILGNNVSKNKLNEFAYNYILYLGYITK